MKLDIIWRTEKQKVALLKEWSKNPRKITTEEYEALKESIQRYGFHDVLKIDIDGTIISGHQRKRALTELGIEEIDVMIPDRNLTEQEREVIAISSNLHRGMFDTDILANQFDEDNLTESGYNIEDLPFDRGLGDGDNDAPDLPTIAKSRLGDIYLLGNHRVMVGDSVKSEDVITLMNTNKARCVFTDPPYNVAYIGKTKDKLTIENDKKSKEDFQIFVDGFINNLLAFCDGAMYICMSSSEWGTIQDSFKRLGGHWSRVIIWVKDRMVLSRADYHTQFEPIMVLNEDENEEGLPILYGWKEGEKRTWNGGRKQTDIWNIKRPSSNKEHPTMKPVELCARAITNSSNIGDIVLDLFLGSGSTLIAAEKVGRICYGMELDCRYMDVILERYLTITGKEPLRERDNKTWSAIKSE